MALRAMVGVVLLLGWFDGVAGASSVLILLVVFGVFAVVQASRLPDVSG